VTKLVSRLLGCYGSSLGWKLESRHHSKIKSGRRKQRSGQHTLFRQKEKMEKGCSMRRGMIKITNGENKVRIVIKIYKEKYFHDFYSLSDDCTTMPQPLDCASGFL
jgi:hypothetical protein